MKTTTVRSRPIFSWAAVEHRDGHALKEAANLRDCARRGVQLAGRCIDRDLAEILLDVADELRQDADCIESMADGNLPGEWSARDHPVSNDTES